MDREEALKKASRANRQIILAIGALCLASLNVNKVMRYLQGVIPRDEVLTETGKSPEATKEALEDMVETYSSQVN